MCFTLMLNLIHYCCQGGAVGLGKSLACSLKGKSELILCARKSALQVVGINCLGRPDIDVYNLRIGDQRELNVILS